jgi:nucleoside-diphosphate-sugar epimerase
MQTGQRTVVVTGGAGYVGSALIPKLLDAGWNVRVLDLYLYDRDVFKPYANNPQLQEFAGDIRDITLVRKVMAGANAVLHLACISNDPSFELDPDLGKSINYDCFPALVDAAKEAGVERFIYASSSSVYGVKDEPNVTEDLPLEPLTDYSKFKALCEDILTAKRAPGFATLTIRPATVCGYAPRQRLDVIVNILTNHAFINRNIKVLGGAQTRPNIHIGDMTDLYVFVLGLPAEKIDGKTYNAGYYNQTVTEIAQTVRTVVGEDVGVTVEPTNDNRSYHISSEKLASELGFRANRSIEQAVTDLVAAFEDGRIKNSMTDPKYYNIRTMQEQGLA